MSYDSVFGIGSRHRYMLDTVTRLISRIIRINIGEIIPNIHLLYWGVYMTYNDKTVMRRTDTSEPRSHICV